MKDSNNNVAMSNVNLGVTTITSVAGTTILTASSTHYQRITGNLAQTIKLPGQTTIPVGTAFIIDNDSTGSVSIVDSASNVLGVASAGSLVFVYSTSNAAENGNWSIYNYLPNQTFVKDGILRVINGEAAWDSTALPSKLNGLAGKNLFNINDTNCVVGSYVNWTAGVLTINGSYNTTGFIPVMAGTTYTLSFKNQIAWYTSSGTYISGDSSATAQQTAPAGAAYLRCSVNVAYWTYFQVEMGSSATLFETYGSYLDKAWIKEAYLPLSKTAFGDSGKNKFNLATVTAGYIDSTGVYFPSSTYSFSVPIPILASTAYIANQNMRYIAFYDVNKVYISGTINVTSITTPSNAAYTVVSVATAGLSIFQLEIGAIPTTYASFYYGIAASALLNYTPPSVGTVSTSSLIDKAVTPTKASFFGASKNLFDYTKVTSGFYVSNTGSVNANATYGYSDFIPVVAGSSYIISSNQIRFSCYYAADKTTVISGGISSNTLAPFKVPAGAAYVIISVNASVLSITQLELGTVATSYASYQPSFDPQYLYSGRGQTVDDIIIPSNIYCLVGASTVGTIEQSNIYFASVCRGYIDDKLLLTTSTYGKNYKECWRIEAGNTSDARYNITSGSFALNIQAQNRQLNPLVNATTTINLVSKASTTAVRLLAFGDSMTRDGAYVNQVLTKLPNIITQGIRHYSPDYSVNLNREGRGGWTLSNYINNYMRADGSDSPFMFPSALASNVYLGNTQFWKHVVNADGPSSNDDFAGFEKIAMGWTGSSYIYDTNGYPISPATGSIVYDPTLTTGTNFQRWTGSAWVTDSTQSYGWSFNFAKYLVRYSMAFPDGNPTHFSILMGANDVGSGFASNGDFATFVSNLETIITSVASAVVGIKFIINLCPVGAAQDGWAGTTTQNSEQYRQNIQKLARYLITTYDNSTSLARNIYISDMQAFLDPVNGFDYVSVPANIYMGTNISRVNNTVHPNVTCGYLQMGDALAAVVQATR
ncbi:MAG: SGNH/GDSL hydrolase family protein [Candidatus Roizmanbacteria bacterium]|nr:SGNH/GDSL hydrolase family protein [Candidatus Roizmanbacteria bacterium]